jgi:hypothetical protein
VKPVVLFRGSRDYPDEFAAAQRHLKVIESRLEVQPDDLVIPRYSALPFYRELEADVAALGARLINTHRQHLFVSEFRGWYERLEGLTPRSWFRLQDVPKDGGPYVLKGCTNSKKFSWRTHMYAETFADAVRVHSRLLEDGLVGQQDIVIREYVPLVTYDTDPQGCPISQEYRFFVIGGKVACGGYYWSNYPECPDRDPSVVPSEFLNSAISKISDEVPFFVIDVAKTAAGDWTVIEINDGQMSGLSECDPDMLYRLLSLI